MEGERRQMERLPPGFRFFPTDGELITYYLSRKAMNATFTTAAIHDVDLYKSEPWDLPCMAAANGGGVPQECYFFCKRSSRYRSGARARRATAGGYWKSTGKDKAVYCGGGGLVGTKKTLVFYGGRAPRGEKTSWAMHEYAMGHTSSSSSFQRGDAQSEWVICKVFMKKPASDHRQVGAMELEVEDKEAAVHGHVSLGCHGRDGDEGEAAPPPVLSYPWHTSRREEPPPLTVNRSCCSSPSWLLHDDQMRSAWPMITEQHCCYPDDLPDLLECAAAGSPAARPTTVRRSRPLLSPTSLRLDEPYWNFGF